MNHVNASLMKKKKQENSRADHGIESKFIVLHRTFERVSIVFGGSLMTCSIQWNIHEPFFFHTCSMIIIPHSYSVYMNHYN